MQQSVLVRPSPRRSASCCSHARRFGSPVSGSESAKCVSTPLLASARLPLPAQSHDLGQQQARQPQLTRRMIARQRHISRQNDAHRYHAHLPAGQAAPHPAPHRPPTSGWSITSTSTSSAGSPLPSTILAAGRLQCLRPGAPPLLVARGKQNSHRSAHIAQYSFWRPTPARPCRGNGRC